MGALRDDEPQFVELTGEELAKAQADYKRIWGDAPDSEPEDPE